ncbi:MAG TPA: hypothetical protein VHL53_08220 [Acidimicrobiia bacterium]|nr:hypothetical protein [Acidimicrobiia bacterium]
MTTVRITPMAPGEFGVEVEEGHEVTGHKIRLPGPFLDDLLLTDVDQERVVTETFDFLLEREPHTSILAEFSLEDVSRYFPDFPEELQRRLT